MGALEMQVALSSGLLHMGGKYRWAGIVLLSLLLVVGFHHWLPGMAGLPLADPLPQDPYIQVYMNHAESSTYRDPYRHIKRYGDDLEAVIVEAIAQAQTSIDVAVQEINLPRIAQALRDRAQAGVAVRVIVENQYNRVWRPLSDFQAQQLDERQHGKQAEQQQLIDANHNGQITAQELDQGDPIRIFERSGIPLLDDTADGSKGSGLMHHKFMVVDGQTVVLGSANWTLSGIHGDFANEASQGNANALLRIQSAALARVLEQEFQLMWGDGPKGKKDSLFGLQKPLRSPQSISIPGSVVTLQFSPVSKSQAWSQSVNGLISRTLAQATREVDLALFVFADQKIANTLAQASQAGVTVKALVDRDFVYRSYSEVLDMLGTAIPDHRCQLEANNRPWQRPITQVGTPVLPEGDKLHHKFALMDDETVIIGSHNWSASANHNNDENLLVIRNRTVATHFRREFDRLMANAQLGLHPDLRDRILRQRKHCGLT